MQHVYWWWHGTGWKKSNRSEIRWQKVGIISLGLYSADFCEGWLSVSWCYISTCLNAWGKCNLDLGKRNLDLGKYFGPPRKSIIGHAGQAKWTCNSSEYWPFWYTFSPIPSARWKFSSGEVFFSFKMAIYLPKSEQLKKGEVLPVIRNWIIRNWIKHILKNTVALATFLTSNKSWGNYIQISSRYFSILRTFYIYNSILF